MGKLLTNNFSKTLKHLMIDKNVRQADLAKYLNVAQGTISAWLSKGVNPKIDQLLGLSQFFQISLDELVTGEKINFHVNEKNSSSPADSKIEFELLEQLEKFSDDYEKTKFLGRVEQLADSLSQKNSSDKIL